MKVLLFTLEYPPFKGGVSRVYENIVKHYPEKDNIFVLHNNDGQLINNKLPFLKWLPSVWQLWRAVKNPPTPLSKGGSAENPLDKGGEGGCHILVGQILPLGTAAYIVSKFTKTKYSVIIHGMDFTFALKSTRKKWLARIIFKNAENIICMNNYVADLVCKFLGEGMRRITVINPGVERMSNVECRMSNELIKKYNLEDKIILFSMGRLVKRKGVDMVLRCLPEVLEEVPNLVYVIGGAGPDEEYLKNIAGKASLIRGVGPASPERMRGEGVIFLGKISDEEKNAWYNICDIFIMPSRQIGDDFEGFGVVFLEANLAGRPVIAGASGGVSDAVADGISGILVNPESEEEIKNVIIKLAKDKDLREKLGEQGRERAEREFGWEGQMGEIYNLVTHNSQHS